MLDDQRCVLLKLINLLTIAHLRVLNEAPLVVSLGCGDVFNGLVLSLDGHIAFLEECPSEIIDFIL